ncbi:MAG: hypothetical protein ABI700_06570 [Chloroflexota bacterium]
MSYHAAAFYITAYPDDCALFRGRQIQADRANRNTKVVFIHTAGGESVDPEGNWQAQGSSSAAQSAGTAQPLTTHLTQINNHPIVVYECDNCATYHLRLPDGNTDGSGFAMTNYESLSKLHDWKPDQPDAVSCTLHALDGSTLYSSWQDFCDTLAGSLAYERQGVYNLHPWINVPDYGAERVRADHKGIADAVRSFARSGFYNRAWWQTFSRPTNLPYRRKVERITALNRHVYHLNTDQTHDCRLVPWYQPDPDLPAYEGS